MDRPYFIVNPVAGSGKGQTFFNELESLMREAGMEYRAVFTQRPYEAGELAQKALDAGERLIYAVGGDGTTNEVAQVLYTTQDAVMGMLPFGTGNDMARALGLPTDVLGCFQMIRAGRTRKMDVGLANQRAFINVAGIGFDVDVLINTEGYKQRYNGMLPYLLGIMKSLTHLRPMRLTLTGDGVDKVQESILIALGNGTHFGGGMNVTPTADPFDGFFDVVLVRRLGLFRFLTLLPGFIKGKHLSRPEVESFRVRELTVSCPEACVVELDGELVEHTPVSFKLLPGQLRVVVAAQ